MRHDGYAVLAENSCDTEIWKSTLKCALGHSH